MFEMCDKVRIKDLGVTGEVIDVGDNYGVPYYLVETDDDFDGEDPRIVHRYGWAIFACRADEIEAI